MLLMHFSGVQYVTLCVKESLLLMTMKEGQPLQSAVGVSSINVKGVAMLLLLPTALQYDGRLCFKRLLLLMAMLGSRQI